MGLILVKIARIINSSVSKFFEYVVGFNSGKKMISKLNHDCLAQVMMYTSILDRLEMENVCQTWREAVELSWCSVKKLDFDDLMIRTKEREEILKKIMSRCCRYLTHLTIGCEYYPWMTDILKENCRRMIHFDMHVEGTCKIFGRELVEMIESMSRIKYLKLSKYRFLDREGIPFGEILQVLPGDIKEIHLFEYGNYLSYRSYGVLSGKFNNIHGLTLQGMEITDETFNSLMLSQNSLTHLDLSDCTFPPGNSSQIFSNFKNIKQLILRRVINFNVDAITSIAHNSPKLTHFELTRGWDKKLPYYILRELRYLNLEHLVCDAVDGDENIISGLGNNWKELKYLDVGGGEKFSLLDLQEITKFKKLEYLNIYKANVESESFINITSNCLGLKELSTRLGRISETALEQLAKLKKLEKFIDNCSYTLSDGLHSKIVNNCKNLVYLNLRSCKNPTQALLIQVGNLEHLKKLEINRIKNVPIEMFYNLRKLEWLSCEGCPSVTDDGIIKVIDNCKKLGCLDIMRTAITVKTLIHAANRPFTFTNLLFVAVDESVEDAFKAKYNSTMSSSQFLQYCFTNFHLKIIS